MELAELRAFTTIADLGSFSRASLHMGVPPATLSRHLARLEADLGAPLFYRNGRGVSLTAAGERFHAAIRPMLADLDRLRREMRAGAGEAGGSVRLGVPPSIGRSIAGSVVLAFTAACPDARLQVVEGFSGTLAEWLEAGTIDAAVLYDCRRSAHLAVSPLLLEDLFLVTAPGPSGPVTLAEAAAAPLILSSRGQGLRRAVESQFEAAGLPFDVAMEIDSIATIKELVATGRYATLLPFGATHREVEDGRLIARPIAGARMVAQLVIGTAHSQPVTRATRALIAIIEDQVAAFVAQGTLRGRVGRGPDVLPFRGRGARASAG